MEALRSTYIHGDIQHGHLSKDFRIELHCSFKVLFNILLPNIFCNPGLQGTMRMQCQVNLTETCQKLPVLSWKTCTAESCTAVAAVRVEGYEREEAYLYFQIHGVFSWSDQLCLHLPLLSLPLKLSENTLHRVNVARADGIPKVRGQLSHSRRIAEAGVKEGLRILQSPISVARHGLGLLSLLRLCACCWPGFKHQQVVVLHLCCLKCAAAKTKQTQ